MRTVRVCVLRGGGEVIVRALTTLFCARVRSHALRGATFEVWSLDYRQERAREAAVALETSAVKVKSRCTRVAHGRDDVAARCRSALQWCGAECTR